MMASPRKNPAIRVAARYGIAVTVCLIALLLRLPLSVFLKGTSAFVAFTPAILFAARFGGIGPGLLATALSALLGAFFVLEPYENLSVDDPRDVSQLGLFIAAGVAISYLGESTRSARLRAKAERQALRQSEQRFQSVVEGVTEYGIYLLDPQGRIVSWNSGARRLKGYSFDEVLGQHFSRFYTPKETASGLPQQLLHRAEAEGTVNSEGWRVRKDGSRFWAHVTLSAIHSDDGTLTGFVKITRDASSQKDAMDGQAGALVRMAEADSVPGIGPA